MKPNSGSLKSRFKWPQRSRSVMNFDKAIYDFAGFANFIISLNVVPRIYVLPCFKNNVFFIFREWA